MQYIFDEILERMTYTLPNEEVDIPAAVVIAEAFKKLDNSTQEYLLSRLAIIASEREEDNV